MLALAGVARHVDVPFFQHAAGQRHGEDAALPVGVEYRLGGFRLGRDGAEAVHAAEVMAAIHRRSPCSVPASGAAGDFAGSTPIMELRVTRRASSSSDQPSVAAGRMGITR